MAQTGGFTDLERNGNGDDFQPVDSVSMDPAVCETLFLNPQTGVKHDLRKVFAIPTPELSIWNGKDFGADSSKRTYRFRSSSYTTCLLSDGMEGIKSTEDGECRYVRLQKFYSRCDLL